MVRGRRGVFRSQPNLLSDTGGWLVVQIWNFKSSCMAGASVVRVRDAQRTYPLDEPKNTVRAVQLEALCGMFGLDFQ